MKIVNKLPKWFLVGLILVLMLVWTANSVYNYYDADKIGAELGAGLGKLAGSAVGSFRGVTDGSAKGYSAGVEAGLEADDVTVEIKNTMLTVGKLEVLIAETKLIDVHPVGETYKAVYEVPGRGVFTVDLNKSNIIFDEQKDFVAVIIPEPQFEFYTDETEVTQIAEFERFSLELGAKDGATAYNKTVDQLKTNAEKYLMNYSELEETAKNAAKTQMEKMVSAIVGDSRMIYVYFQ